MNRLPHLMTVALLVTSLACGSEGGRTGGAGGRAGGSNGTSRGPDAGAGPGTSGTGGAGVEAGGGRTSGSPTGGSSVAIGGSPGSAGSAGSAGDTGTGPNADAGATGASSARAGAGAIASSGTSGGTTGTTATAMAGAGSSGGRPTSTSSGTSSTGSTGSKCTGCHGDSATNDPSPPSDTEGNTDTVSPGVGAHSQHLAVSGWHRRGQCADCHTQPTSTPHANGTVDFTWGATSTAKSAKPSFSTTGLTCTGAYCHGTTLPGASAAKTTPVWNQVNGSWNACGNACHATPPAASTGHPASAACEKCHGKVIASFEGTSAQTTWKDASLHINGTVEVDTLTCTTCHGSGTNPAPPKDTQGGTATTAAGVGAHAQHLATSTWHRQGQCADCHKTPTSTSHANNLVDFSWGAPSNASGATPSFTADNLSCSGAYCHGAKMTDKSTSVGHVPVWTKVDGTHDACGKACHANPPAGGSHTATSTACQSCHGDVITTYNGANSTWKNPALHINGKVEASAMACGSCHGNPPTTGTHRRREHQVTCTNCHPDPNGTTHRNGKTDQSCGSNRAGCHDGDD